jgi:hypothetical protein
LIKIASAEINNLTKRGVVIFCGGSNDLAESNSKIGLNNFTLLKIIAIQTLF